MVSTYLLEISARLPVDSVKREAADLRALLRFLYLDGSLRLISARYAAGGELAGHAAANYHERRPGRTTVG